MEYATILADPPWPYHSPKALVGNAGRGAQNGLVKKMKQVDVLAHYKVMSIDQIKVLPISEMVVKNAHLYLWTTNSFIVEAHDVAKAWGFKPKTILTWVKTKKTGPTKPSMKTGYWFRSATEHIVFAVRGKQKLLGPKPMPTAYLLPKFLTVSNRITSMS